MKQKKKDGARRPKARPTQAGKIVRIKPKSARARQAQEHAPAASAKHLKDLVQQLQIHQVELKLQNEELRRTQVELALSRDRYTDLYEFAPIAYVTLDKRGIILEGNLMAAKLLGIERRSLWRANLAK